jgi:hypothetical protein
MNDVIISSFNSYYNHSKYCELEKKMMPDRYDHPKVCNFIEKIGIDFTQMHTNTFKVNNVSNKANVTYNGPGVLDIIVELKGSVNDLPYNPEWKRMTDVFLRYVEDFLPLVGYRLMDFLGARVLYLDGETFLIEKTAYLFMTTEIYSARELSDNDNWEVDYVFEEINRIKEVMGLLNESKMSEFDLESYKSRHKEMGNNEWLDILDRFPEEFQREIVDELPNGSEDEINTIKNWELDPSHPIEMNLLNLLQTDSVKEAIGRTPRHVMEMIKTNPRYRLELEDVEHVSDIEVGREYGLKSGEIFDQNPKRYEEYANYDPKTAEPSTIVNGELWWGTGRLIAALLRGDMTIKVWAVTDFTTNRP